MNSQYLPSDVLNADPIENARKRRQMLEDTDSDDDSIDEHGWRITKDMMDRMDNSSWLRKELSDGGLRQMIAEIDNADWEKKSEFNSRKKRIINPIEILTPRETALERAKYTNKKFSEFLDRLMLTAGVLVENDVQADDKIAALIKGEVDSSNLSLVAIPSKARPKLTDIDSSPTSPSSSDDSNEDSDEASSDGSSESES